MEQAEKSSTSLTKQKEKNSTFMDFFERIKILEAKTTRKKIQTEIQRCTDSDLKVELELKAKYIGINEYYPTPYKVCEYIAEMVALPYHPQDDFKILEPSAGTGSLAENLLHIFGFWEKTMFDVCEINPDFQEHLKWKGFNVISDNCMKLNDFNKYDLLIMNPPFEYVKEHLKHCIKLLKPNKPFVCIAPKIFPTKNVEFIEEYEIGVITIEDNSFKSSCTNVRTVILVGYSNDIKEEKELSLF